MPKALAQEYTHHSSSSRKELALSEQAKVWGKGSILILIPQKRQTEKLTDLLVISQGLPKCGGDLVS